MDKLEKFIKENRNSLDRYDPSADTWRKIKKGIGAGRKPAFKWISIAAMVVLILGSALLVFNMTIRRNNLFGTSYAEQKDLKETEIFYKSTVNTLYLEARPMLTGQPEIKEELDNDLARIDSLCADMRKDLKDNVANEEVVEALIQNYRIKIQILEDMLGVLKKNNGQVNKTKENHEL
jgi:hypothetical protein